MLSSIHADRTGHLYVDPDHAAAGLDGTDARPLHEVVPLPDGARLVPLPRAAMGFGRNGRARELGSGRLAVGAVLPRGWVRLLTPSYADDPNAADLERLPYCAVADESGAVVVAARAVDPAAPTAESGDRAAGHAGPANSLVRQLARCARDNACESVRASTGHGDLPVPLGAPAAERARAPVALRSGYPGSPVEAAAFRPSAEEIADLAIDHLDRGGAGLSFGRACDGEPLARVAVIEGALELVRARTAGGTVHLETSGSDPVALRRAIEAGVTSVTVRMGAATPGTYELLHGPISHRWADVRASARLASERGVALTIALLLLPGLTDRAGEIDALAAFLGELAGGRVELRDLGADPVRAIAAFPRVAASGMDRLLARLAEADHFTLAMRSRAPAVR
ncbi:MAG: radical SAM protein [Chloroflexi bacterium]|nr:radical SAM protein [Chloroflexota bacterium]